MAYIPGAERNKIPLVLPTGFGKLMIYGLLPLIFDRAKGKLNYIC